MVMKIDLITNTMCLVFFKSDMLKMLHTALDQR